jgi:monoamine oxidase
MALSGGAPSLATYLDERTRQERNRAKQLEAMRDGLTPDWFIGLVASGIRCLPQGGLRVAVVGAGFAGLMAGWYLSRCGADVTVYEADTRVGGRVQTDRAFVAPRYVEAGAELIGENHALWNLYATRFGLPLVPLTEYPHSRLRLGGRDLPPADQDRMDAEVELLQLALGALAFGVNQTEPWTHREARRWDAMSIDDAFADKPLRPVATKDAREWMAFTLGNDNCASISDQSFLGLLGSISAARMGGDPQGMRGYFMSTETHRCRNGNDLLGERFSRDLTARRQLELNTMVIDVTVQGGTTRPVVVTVERNPVGTAVAGPSVARFDHLILATPPSVWPATQFTPTFPVAGRSLHQGPAIKFITRYPTRFWLQRDQAPYEDMPAARWDRMGSLWEGTDNQPDLRLVDPFGAQPVALSVYAGGDIIQPQNRYPQLVATMFPRGRPGPPNPPPTEQWIDWPHRPGIMTGYGVPLRGQASTVFPEQVQPHAGRVWFAGEQTSPGFFGYMEGALQSGARAARDILRVASVLCPSPMRTAMADLAPGSRPGVGSAAASEYLGGGRTSGAVAQ